MLDVDREQLGVLLEERAILRTLYRYAHAMDYGHEEDWVRTFTTDGVFDVVRMPDRTTIHREDGAGDLAAYIAGYAKPPNVRKHILLNPLIELDGDQAQVDSYWLFLGKDTDGATIQAFGRYHDTLRKVDGEWRIASRYAETESIEETAGESSER